MRHAFAFVLACCTISCGNADAKPEAEAFTCGELFGTGNISLVVDEAQGVLSTASSSGWNRSVSARFSPAIVHGVEYQSGDKDALVYSFDRVAKVLTVQTVDCGEGCAGLNDEWQNGEELSLPDASDEKRLAVHCFTQDDVSSARKR